MATLSIQLDDMKTAREFVDSINEKLSSKDLLKNPFNGFAKIIRMDDKIISFIHLNAVYPRMYIFALLTFLPILLFKGFVWSNFYFITLFFIIADIPHWSIFYYFIFAMGLRKKGYAGDIKLMSNKEVMIRVMEKWDKEK